MKLTLLTLLVSVSATAADFEWHVPEQVDQIDVAGTPVAQGIPMRLASATSRLSAEALLRHFAERFEAHGLYIAPEKDQVQLEDGYQLTALDTEKLLAFTVMLRPLPGGKTTRVLMGTSNLSAVRAPQSSLPVFPGATSVLTAELEAGRTLSFVVRARAEEIDDFYRETLKAAGFESKEPGGFQRGGERLVLRIRALDAGRLTVVLTASGH